MCVIAARLDNEKEFKLSLIENCSGMSPANQALWHWRNKILIDHGVGVNPKNFNEVILQYKPCMISWCRYIDGLGMIDLPFQIKLHTEKETIGMKTTIISENCGDGILQLISPDILKF